MDLVNILNNFSSKRDIFEFLRDRRLSDFSVKELDEALLMLDISPQNYSTKEDKFRAIVNWYRP